LIEELGLPDADQEKLFYRNARRILGLRDSIKPGIQQPAGAVA
jgi:hypothetical protein